jgi:PAS domain S-box-containing protein
LVDDLPANLVALRAVLDDLGPDLVAARSGEEALALLRQRALAVVLLDVQLGRMDGFEVARLIRARPETRATPIIFLTAYDADRAELERGYALGAVDFLSKPLAPTALRAKVGALAQLYEDKVRAGRQAEQYRLLVEGTKDYAIFMLDTEGRVATWNAGAERLKGYSAGEIIGKHFSTFYPPDAIERGWPAEELRRAVADGRIEDEGWRVRKDGSRFWANVVITALRDETGTLRGFGKVTRDLTERRAAEESARRLASEEAARRAAEAGAEEARRAQHEERRQREQLRVTLASIGDAVITTDGDGRVDFLNPVAEALTGWTAQEARGRPLPGVFHIVNETTRQPVENPALRALSEGVIVGLANHTVLIARDGTERPIDDSAAPIRDSAGVVGAVLVFRDITDRKRAEAEVRRAGEQARTILESITDAFCAFDRQWRFTYVNRQAEVLLGRSRTDLIGKNHWDEYPDTLGTETERAYRRAAGEGVAVAFEVFYPPHDRWYEIHAYPSADGLGVYFRDATERRRAAEALRRSEERFRLLAETIPQLAWTARADGHIEWYNRRWYEYTGTTPEEMEGWGWQAVHDPRALPAVLDRWKSSIATGEPFEMVFPLKGADGRFRPFLTRVSPLRDGEGRIVSWFGTNTDIGALKEAEDRLRVSEARFRQLADAMPQIVWTAGPDGQIDYSNRRWHEYTGLTEGVGNAAWSAVVHPDDMPAAAERWAESLRSGAAFDMELRLLDGHARSYRWHLLRTVPVRDESGAVARWYGTATDIDGQRRAADSARFLSEASAALATVVDYESTLQRVAGLAVPHFADWSAVDAAGEGGALRRLAVAHREPAKVRLAQELHDRYPPDPAAPTGAAAVLRSGRAEIVADITDEMLVQGARDEEHLRLVRGLGLRSYICVPLVVSGKSLGVLSFVTAESGRRYTDADLALAEDLARRAAVAIENVRLYQELREADRRKDEFLALLGHELRNPLAPIKNAVQILELKGGDPPTAARARAMIGRQVDHLTRLVDEILDASRIARGKVRLAAEPLDLAALVRTTVEDHRAEAEAAGLAVEVALPPEPVWVRGDPARLSQVVTNLWSNAVKFTERGGRVIVRLTVGEVPPAKPEGFGEAVLSVADTGVGIDPANVPTLFQPFRQVEADVARTKGGLGLGLAVVKGLVELHGGRVEAASAGRGRGATFTARLPLGAAGPAPASGHPTAGPAANGLRVVIVEDGADTAESLGELLELRGFVVALAATGPEGVELCRRLRPEAVVCDLGLPGMSGFDVARALRADAATAGAVLVAVSGYAQDEDRRRARDAGFDALLAKPARADDLVRLLIRPTT